MSQGNFVRYEPTALNSGVTEFRNGVDGSSLDVVRSGIVKPSTGVQYLNFIAGMTVKLDLSSLTARWLLLINTGLSGPAIISVVGGTVLGRPNYALATTGNLPVGLYWNGTNLVASN